MNNAKEFSGIKFDGIQILRCNFGIDGGIISY